MKLKFLPIFLFFTFCGVNTDVSVNPYLLLIPPGAPQIAHIIPINSNYETDFTLSVNQTLSPAPEFLVKYYVTNIEPQYTGNNLYITSTVPSIAETYANLNQNMYLPNGVQPSFNHSPDTASNTKLVTQRISYQTPPPGVIYFQKCEIYTFSMRAVLNTGTLSNQSVAVSGCASLNPSSCPTNTGCNPDACNVAGCANPAGCAVGTLCNPCKIAGKELLGCECTPGTSPPGCN